MAAGDQVQVRKVYTNEVGEEDVTTNGVPEYVTLADFMLLLPEGEAAGDVGLVTAQAAPAAAPVPFADLTAAANYCNTLRTALIAAGVFIAP